jgi:hypothetical protein
VSEFVRNTAVSRAGARGGGIRTKIRKNQKYLALGDEKRSYQQIKSNGSARSGMQKN